MKLKRVSFFVSIFALVFLSACGLPKVSTVKDYNDKYTPSVADWRLYVFNIGKEAVGPQIQSFDSAFSCYVENLHLKKSKEIDPCIQSFSKIVDLSLENQIILLDIATRYDSTISPTVLEKPLKTKLYTFSNIPYITLMIGGKEYSFIIDTGCQFSIISNLSDIIASAKDSKISELVLNNGQDDKLEANTILTVELENDGTKFLNEFIAVPEDNLSFKSYLVFGKKVDGIIGWNLLKNYRFLIDYKNEKFVMENSSKINRRYDLFYFTHPFVINSLDTNAIEYYFVDTGASLSKFYTTEELKNIEKSEKQTISGTVEENYELRENVKIRIKDYIFTYKKANFYFKESESEKNNMIGSDAFINGSLLIDYPNGIFEYTE